MYQGDPVAAVAADTEERALDAARLVRVRYEPLPHLSSVEQALAADAPRCSRAATRARAPGTKPATLRPDSRRLRTSSRPRIRRT